MKNLVRFILADFQTVLLLDSTVFSLSAVPAMANRKYQRTDKLCQFIEEPVMIAEQEQIARLAVVQNALASQRLEGLEPEAQALEDARKWASGEKSISQAIADFKARLQQNQHEIRR